MTTQTALAHGISRSQLAGPAYRTLTRGVHLSAEAPLSFQTWIDAARQLLPPEARLTGLTALRVHGFGFGPLFPLHFHVPKECRLNRTGIRTNRLAHMPVQGGVATIEEAYAAATADLNLVETVQLAEAILLQRPDLVDALRDRSSGRASELIRVGPESVQETRVRLMLVLAGLPEPAIQAPVHDDRGLFVGRLDHLFEEFDVGVEYDGRQHAESQSQWNRDLNRREALDQRGIRLVVLTRDRLWPPTDAVLRVHAALKERGYRGPEPWFDMEWRTLFGAGVR